MAKYRGEHKTFVRRGKLAAPADILPARNVVRPRAGPAVSLNPILRGDIEFAVARILEPQSRKNG
jgi:hypothetical protein